jgi:hypothetical protein
MIVEAISVQEASLLLFRHADARASDGRAEDICHSAEREQKTCLRNTAEEHQGLLKKFSARSETERHRSQAVEGGLLDWTALASSTFLL